MNIRPTAAADMSALVDVHRAAFGSDLEADLASALMRDGSFVPSLSMCAEDEQGQLVGHALLTRARLQRDGGGTGIPLLLLAPLAVIPAEQGKGVGSALLERAIELARAAGETAIVVLGHSGYYRRFGFEQAQPKGVRAPYDVPIEAWMILELDPAVLDGVSGKVLVANPLAAPELWCE